MVEATARATVAVVVAAHHDGRLLVARQEPEARQRLAVQVHVLDQVRQQPLLLVGLGYRDLAQVDPVGLDVALFGTEEEVIGADRSDAVALVPGPRGVALSGVDDRLGEVVGKGGGLSSVRPDTAKRHGGVRGGGVGAGVEGGDRLGAARRVAVGRAVELDRLADDAGARRQWWCRL